MKQARTKTARSAATSPLEVNLTWSKTDDAVAPWRTQVGPDTWTVRVNDFPEEHLYTLLINDRESASFDNWPEHWTVREPLTNSR